MAGNDPQKIWHASGYHRSKATEVIMVGGRSAF